MRGIEHPIAVFLDYLEGRLPDAALKLEGDLGVDTTARLEVILERIDGDPARPRLPMFLPGGPRPPDRHPAVFVEGRDTTAAVMTDPGGPTGLASWEVTYRLRTWVYVRGQEHVDTLARRDRLTLATRRVLLDRPRLGTGPGDGALRVNPSSLRESYSGVDADNAGGSIAAAYLDLEVVVTEELDLGGDRHHVDTTALTPHPALD